MILTKPLGKEKFEGLRKMISVGENTFFVKRECYFGGLLWKWLYLIWWCFMLCGLISPWLDHDGYVLMEVYYSCITRPHVDSCMEFFLGTSETFGQLHGIIFLWRPRGGKFFAWEDTMSLRRSTWHNKRGCWDLNGIGFLKSLKWRPHEIELE